MSVESQRLIEAREQQAPWRLWGPYLSERQWGTVREDYSENGNAWDYLPHDHARSRAYRWGEDGLAGVSDDQQLLCLALSLWNGNDPILKERLFGLTNGEGNHGEDVKEYYFYLDNLPSHAWMRYLYKYPVKTFPYLELVEQNAKRSRQEREFELVDTGIFNESDYFDVFIEYAKANPTDLLMNIRVENRSQHERTVHLLPTLWFRNTWQREIDGTKPQLRASGDREIIATHPEIGEYHWYADGDYAQLFTENETNTARLFDQPNASPYVKDGFHVAIVNGQMDAVNPAKVGTKAAYHGRFTIPGGGSITMRLRLSHSAIDQPFQSFDTIIQQAEHDADQFYHDVIPEKLSEDERRVVRQALAGLLWTKQFYYYDVDQWIKDRNRECDRTGVRQAPRNTHWQHMVNADVISMPDKWEYPWYAAWDLAFHVVAFTMIDEEFGRHQLELMLRERYIHPNGQIPAYEWNFGDVNPPVHAWATLFTHNLRSSADDPAEHRWLERMFHKLLLNFTWWVNQKDRTGRNVFEGGFLGLDNIGVFDRSHALPTGGHLEQADGTAWMALYSQNMLEMAIELAQVDSTYDDMVVKFVEHFLWIASAMFSPTASDQHGMWDEPDGFFYDVLRLPDNQGVRLKVRSVVGLLPLCAVTIFDNTELKSLPEAMKRINRFIKNRPELIAEIHDPRQPGEKGRFMFSLLNETRLRRVLAALLDENEFLSAYGIRSLSKFHAANPYQFFVGSEEYRVDYIPGESDSGMFGGNSNWRGPIWIPINTLIIRSLFTYYRFYGNQFQIECPTGSGQMMNLFQVAKEIARRLSLIFVRDEKGRRAVNGNDELFQNDPHWRDLIPFYEYFHGDTGEGLGASHQTGWTGMIARTLHFFANIDEATALRASSTIIAQRLDATNFD